MKKLLGCFLCVMLLVFGLSVNSIAIPLPSEYILVGGSYDLPLDKNGKYPGNDKYDDVAALVDWFNSTASSPLPDIVDPGGEAPKAPEQGVSSGEWDTPDGLYYSYFSVKAGGTGEGSHGGFALYYIPLTANHGYFDTGNPDPLNAPPSVLYNGWYDLSGHNLSHVSFWNPGETPPVPEPATMLLLGSGLLGLGVFGRKKIIK